MQNNIINHCPLCNGVGATFYQFKKRLYYQCDNCYGVFVDKRLIPGKDAELSRYKEHNNDIDDEKYQNFVSPIYLAVMKDYRANSKGLDFGAGTGPVVSKVLKDNGYLIAQYDPFFHNYPDLLAKKYDYIVCCEVIEHFHNPKKEFALLKEMLRKNGKIYCMTNLYDESIDFHNWHYKNDLTHVFIYHENTVHWIKKEFEFSKITIEDRLLTFIK